MKTRRVINLWPSGDCMFFATILLLLILFVGEPDLLDAIIYRLMDCPKQVDND